MESILTSVKKLLGITEDYEYFDQDIIMHINAVLAVLIQVGVGPFDGFAICDKTATWDDFISNDPRLSMVKSYVYLRVRQLFDPPLSSAVADSMNRQISELEWRLFAATDPVETEMKNQNG